MCGRFGKYGDTKRKAHIHKTCLRDGGLSEAIYSKLLVFL